MIGLALKDREIRAMRLAYNALQRLDGAGKDRALSWLKSRFESDKKLAVALTDDSPPAQGGREMRE